MGGGLALLDPLFGRPALVVEGNCPDACGRPSLVMSYQVPMRPIGLVIPAASLVLALRAVEAQQALRELGDALMEIRC